MIGDWPILTIVTFLPLFGALFLLMIRGEDEVVAQNARHVRGLSDEPPRPRGEAGGVE